MTPLDLDQPGVDELLHVVGKQRLVDGKQRDQLALTYLCIATSQHIEDADAHGLGQRLGRSRDALGIQAGIKPGRRDAAVRGGGSSGGNGEKRGRQINSYCYESLEG